MKILGINACGWLEVAHDASAVLVEDGKIKWAIEEERLIRQKRAYDKKPINAIHFCLNNEGILLDEIDRIVFSWDWKNYGPEEAKKFETSRFLLDKFFPKKYFNYKKKPNIAFVEHHLAHASSTFRCSGFKDAAILVIDGQGEYCSSSIWLGEKDGTIQHIWNNDIENSLGFFYSAACRYIGMDNGDEGKLMGLAPYGKPKESLIKEFSQFKPQLDSRDLLRRDGQMKPIIRQWLEFFERKFGPIDKTKVLFDNFTGHIKKEVNFTKFQKEFAASAQKFLELEVLKLVKKALKLTGKNRLCLSGGVAMNCIVNSRILEEGLLKEIYVQPASNDAGTAIGAALEISSHLEKKQFNRLNNIYLGPSFTNSEIKNILDNYKLAAYRLHGQP